MKSTAENRMHMEGEACLRVNTSSTGNTRRQARATEWLSEIR